MYGELLIILDKLIKDAKLKDEVEIIGILKICGYFQSSKNPVIY